MAAYVPAPFFTASHRRRGFLAALSPAGQYDEARRALESIAAYLDVGIESEASGDRTTADQVYHEPEVMAAGESCGLYRRVSGR